LLVILDLGVAERRLARRTPIDDAVAAIDHALVVEIDEHLEHRLGTTLIHRERLARPVARRTQTAQLLLYPAAVFFFPRPSALQKALAPHVFLGQALFLFHVLDHLDLGRDGRVIRARQPKRAIA